MFSSPRLQHGCENLVCMHEHCVSAYGQTCCNLTCKISFPQRCLRTGGGGGGGHHGLYSPGGGGFGGRRMPGAIHLPPSSQATLAAGVADWLLRRKLKYHTKLLCQLSPPLLLHRSCFRRAATGLHTVKIPRKSYMCCLNPAWKFATASKPANFVFSSFFSALLSVFWRPWLQASSLGIEIFQSKYGAFKTSSLSKTFWSRSNFVLGGADVLRNCNRLAQNRILSPSKFLPLPPFQLALQTLKKLASDQAPGRIV